MRVGVSGFQPERLRQARLVRGITQTALANLVGKASATVSKWERGEQAPEHDALERLALRLAVPAAWFLKAVPPAGEAVSFFRSTSAATRTAREIADVRLTWVNELSVTLQASLEWPCVKVPALEQTDYRNISDSEIESAALECRRLWQLGFGPISDVVLALENAGIICVRDELGYANMDGVSRWFAVDNRPYVFLASDKANGVRSRFDAAHELAHIALHGRLNSVEFNKRHSEIERQANLFAGAFLMPAEAFAAEVSRPGLDTFLALKSRWKVSVAAMIMRCKQLGVIDEDYGTRLWKSYSARGWRRGEPDDEKIPFEPPRLMPRAIELLLTDGGLTKEGLLSSLGLGANDCERLCGLPDGFFSQDASVTQFTRVRLRSTAEMSDGRMTGGQVIAFPSKAPI